MDEYVALCLREVRGQSTNTTHKGPKTHKHTEFCFFLSFDLLLITFSSTHTQSFFALSFDLFLITFSSTHTRLFLLSFDLC